MSKFTNQNTNPLEFEEFRYVAKKAFTKPLPGITAQSELAPIGRESHDPNLLDTNTVNTAGVLALFVEHKKTPHLVLIERATYKGVHSGQIAFPGGRKENQDVNFRDTALRETEEEIGLPATNIEILGSFTPIYIPPSNFLVHPYAGIYNELPKFIPQQSEVANIIQMDFNHLLDQSAIKDQKISVRGFNMTVPTFCVDGHTIWGATAMMLNELRQMILSAR